MNKATTEAYLAFDLGASSGRAILGTLVDGKLEMEAVHRFETPILETPDGLFWDLDDLWGHLKTGLTEALKRTDHLKSLSVDSWGVDYVPVDEDGIPVRPAYCYRDQRTNGKMDDAFACVPAEAIYASTGIQFMPINTVYQVLADVHNQPDLLPRTANRLPIADFFNYRFGGKPVSEISLASTTQLMRVGRPEWDSKLMRELDIPDIGWPEIVASGTAIGRVSRHPGAQVVASCSHDTGCAVAATPARGNNWAYISCGTWSLLGIERSQPLVSENARIAGFTNEAGCGGTIRFLKNLTGLWALQECVREWGLTGPGVYDNLLAEAEAAADPVGLVDLEDDRFLKRGGMEARICAYCRENGLSVPASRGEVSRLILESIAESYRRAITALEHVIGQAIDTVYIVGGGSQNSLLCQSTAKACSKPVVAGPIEATAIGNLLIQMQTMGGLPEGQSIRDVVRASFPLQSYVP